MVHIVTIHWKDDRWIDIQLKYLNKNIKIPFKIYAFLNSMPRDHRSKYFYVSTENIKSHATKLNLLADIAALHSTCKDDWLIFIDGDAFPIENIVSYGQSKLREYPLLAIQRKENNGDIQPHPSFCLTTIRFWKEIGGDWRKGYKWRDSNGKLVTDVGGNLLAVLNGKQIKWYPILRSNKKNIHPLWFGIYEDIIYHHGAGFRQPISRFDMKDVGQDATLLFKGFKLFHKKMPRCFHKTLMPLMPGQLVTRIEQNKVMEKEIFQSILKNPYFYQAFQKPDPQ